MKYFGIYQKKSKFSFYFLRRREKLNFFPSHFSIILLGSELLVGIILGGNKVCTYKRVYYVILMDD